MSGTEIGVLPFDKLTVDVLDISPEVSVGSYLHWVLYRQWLIDKILHNIPQPDLQGIIAEMLEKEAKVERRRGWTWRSFTEVGTSILAPQCLDLMEQSDSEAVSIVENTYTGETEEIRSSVIIACDGTNSRVRQAAGIELDEQDGRKCSSCNWY
jgi:2-polyprenyl-6-methoxyphenol hydroxylase-like FAD-dependent oxidoreductase